MWKRGTTWATLALLVWFNFMVWNVYTSYGEYTGAITLREHQIQAQGQADAVTQYTRLAPSYFFGPLWFSYALALFIGFGLPFILPRLVPWLWRRGKPLVQRLWGTPAGWKIAVCLVLLVVCNFLAWNVKESVDDYPGVISLSRDHPGSSPDYILLLPAWMGFGGLGRSYAVAALIGFGLPFLLPHLVPWLWRRLSRLYQQPPMAGEIRPALNPQQGKKSGGVLAGLALFVAFNVVAWDWAESNSKDGVVIVLGEKETGDGWYGRQTLYYGVNPGVLLSGPGVSFVLSFFVGEILPFLLLPSLRRRRPPPALALPPVAGAPR